MSGQQLSMEQSEKVQTAGRNLLLYIFSMIKTGEIHDLNNEAWIRPSEKINDVIRELFKYERRRLTFIIHEGTAQLNSHALWLDKNTMETTEEMERMFAMREIGGIIIRDVPKEDTLKEFFYELARFRSEDSADGAFQTLRDILVKRGVSTIACAPRPNRLDEVGSGVRGVRALWTYGKAVAGFQEVMERQPIEIKRARRLAQEIVDACSQEQDLMIGMSTSGGARNRERITVDAAVLCASIGRALGMSRQACGDLATTGLLSSVGAAYLDERNTNVDVNFAISALTFRQLAEGSNLTASFLQRVGIASEWADRDRDANYALEGAPKALPLTVLIRSVRRFLSRVHGVSNPPETPLQAMVALLDNATTPNDKNAISLLALTVGFLPVGSIIRLQNGDLAVVSEVDHIRGVRAFSAAELPISVARKTYVRRIQDKANQPIAERDARICLGESAPSGEWTAHAILSSLGLEELVLRGVFPNLPVVRTQVGVQ